MRRSIIIMLICALCAVFAGCRKLAENLLESQSAAQKGEFLEKTSRELGFDIEAYPFVIDDYAIDFQGQGSWFAVLDCSEAPPAIAEGGNWTSPIPDSSEVNKLLSKLGRRPSDEGAEGMDGLWFDDRREPSDGLRLTALYDKDAGMLAFMWGRE